MASTKEVLVAPSAAPALAVRALLQKNDCLSLPHLLTQCARALALPHIAEVRVRARARAGCPTARGPCRAPCPAPAQPPTPPAPRLTPLPPPPPHTHPAPGSCAARAPTR